MKTVYLLSPVTSGRPFAVIPNGSFNEIRNSIEFAITEEYSVDSAELTDSGDIKNIECDMSTGSMSECITFELRVTIMYD